MNYKIVPDKTNILLKFHKEKNCLGITTHPSATCANVFVIHNTLHQTNKLSIDLQWIYECAAFGGW